MTGYTNWVSAVKSIFEEAVVTTETKYSPCSFLVTSALAIDDAENRLDSRIRLSKNPLHFPVYSPLK